MLRNLLVSIIFVCLVFSFGCRKKQPVHEPNIVPKSGQLQPIPQAEVQKKQVQESIDEKNMDQELERLEKEIRQDIADGN